MSRWNLASGFCGSLLWHVVLILLRVALPDPLDGVGEKLGFGVVDAVARILAEEVLVFVAFRF